MATSFGELMKESMEAKNLSVRDVGKAVGVDHSYIGKIAVNRKKPSPKILDKLIDLLDMDKNLALRLLGQHVETLGVELETKNPHGVDIMYKLTEALDDEGKKTLNYIMLEMKSGVDNGNINKEKILEALNKLSSQSKRNELDNSDT